MTRDHYQEPESNRNDISESMKPTREEANDINRRALVKHLMLQNPTDALKLHFRALALELEFSQWLSQEQGTTCLSKMSLEEGKQNLAQDFVVTLIDIGNCFWSSERSKIAYYSALEIYTLMNMNKPVLKTSIMNRLYKLDPFNIHNAYSPDSMAIIGGLVRNKKFDKEYCRHDDNWPAFNRTIEVIKNTAAQLQGV